MKIISVSLPEEQAKELKARAKKENVSQSQLVRAALKRDEFRREWAEIRERGRETALKFNITSYDDVERLIGRHAK